MTGAAPREVHALYSLQNGLHVFTSAELPGMVHANKNLQQAFNSLSDAVSTLVSIKFGVPEQYQTCISFNEFNDAINSPDRFPVGSVVLAAKRRALHSDAH